MKKYHVYNLHELVDEIRKDKPQDADWLHDILSQAVTSEKTAQIFDLMESTAQRWGLEFFNMSTIGGMFLAVFRTK